MRIMELDYEKLGKILMQMPLGTFQLNHSSFAATLRDYVETSEENKEGEFIKDLFTLRPDEVAEKWYDGKIESGILLMTLMEEDRKNR